MVNDSMRAVAFAKILNDNRHIFRFLSYRRWFASCRCLRLSRHCLLLLYSEKYRPLYWSVYTVQQLRFPDKCLSSLSFSVSFKTFSLVRPGLLWMVALP